MISRVIERSRYRSETFLNLGIEFFLLHFKNFAFFHKVTDILVKLKDRIVPLMKKKGRKSGKRLTRPPRKLACDIALKSASSRELFFPSKTPRFRVKISLILIFQEQWDLNISGRSREREKRGLNYHAVFYNWMGGSPVRMLKPLYSHVNKADSGKIRCFFLTKCALEKRKSVPESSILPIDCSRRNPIGRRKHQITQTQSVKSKSGGRRANWAYLKNSLAVMDPNRKVLLFFLLHYNFLFPFLEMSFTVIHVTYLPMVFTSQTNYSVGLGFLL